jgi:hypothetical protein
MNRFSLSDHFVRMAQSGNVFTSMPRGCILALLSLSLSAWAAQPLGTDLSGRPVDRLAPPGSRVIVLFFAGSDCPISNRYIPEIERLSRQFGSYGVHFWWVYPNPADSADVVRHHQDDFHINGEAVLDTQQRLTRMAHVTVTPEVAIFVPAAAGLREVYRGRIDNRYVALGQERPSATRHDMEDAIRAVLADRVVPRPGGPAVGCSIVPRNVP